MKNRIMDWIHRYLFDGVLIALIVVAVLTVTGCATKRYTIAQPLSAAEVDLLDCDDLRLEMIRVGQIEEQINETGQADARTVFGVLGDFGIGNGMAKAEARKALAAREQDIREAQATKNCGGAS